MAAKRLINYPAHLGPGGSAVQEPLFAGDMQWYADYEARHLADGAEGRLVCEFRFTEDWDCWEMHPAGAELVYCLAGKLTLHQEQTDGSCVATVLMPGDYAINPPGVWHTADVEGEARALFVTAGAGTRHRPR